MPGGGNRTGAYLVALTPESGEAIAAREINIPHLPFRIGRESRRARWTDKGLVAERRKTTPANNDLYLLDQDEPLNVSREHMQIDRDERGFFLLDRGSTCGTLVEGNPVGGSNQQRRIPLSDHDVIIIGTSLSRFIFKFRAES